MKQCALYGNILYHLLNHKNVILAFIDAILLDRLFLFLL